MLGSFEGLGVLGFTGFTGFRGVGGFSGFGGLGFFWIGGLGLRFRAGS